MNVTRIAGYLFLLGLIAAVIAGLGVGLSTIAADVQAWIAVMFMIIGVVIGACMSTSKKLEEEVYVLVLISLVLLVASQMNVFTNLNVAITNLGTALNLVVANIALFSAAAMIVLAIRTLTHFHISKIK
jgi:hypothetical protein